MGAPDDAGAHVQGSAVASSFIEMHREASARTFEVRRSK